MGLDGVVETEVMCSCHDHLLQLSSWDDGDLFVTIWSPIERVTWGRFHWAWESLKGRWNGNNEIVFDRESATALRDSLSAHLERSSRS